MDTEPDVWGKYVMDGMMPVFFLISILSAAAGSICGIGGGVILKPVLDTAGIMSVSGISFLSGCTVLAMSTVSVCKNLHGRREKLNLKLVVPLAVGGAAGGAIGKTMFQALKQAVDNERLVGLVQAVVLIIITFGTLIYTVCRGKIHTLRCGGICLSLTIGLLLGIMSSFLGIGGGPINIVVLEFFFSMKTKEAAASSLFLIMFSQFTGLAQTLLTGTIPQVRVSYLIVMTVGGIAGGMIGGRISKRLDDKRVSCLFVILMVVIVGINIRNAIMFSGAK